MKNSPTSVTRVLLASVFAVGAVAFTGTVSADPAGLTPGSSDDMLLASTDFKGEHRYTSHTAYERKDASAQLERKLVAEPLILRGKPPYNRHTAKYHELEKVQFVRFEEQPAVTKDEHRSIYYYGTQRPPYKRNR